MTHRVTMSVNGAIYTHEVESRLLLVHYLRDVLNLTGTHVGCDILAIQEMTAWVTSQDPHIHREDLHASRAYRAQLGRVLSERALQRAVERAAVPSS